MQKQEIKFWAEGKEGEIKISHLSLYESMGQFGFFKFQRIDGSYGIAREVKNVVKEVKDEEIIDFIQIFLKRNGRVDVLEVFASKLPSLISTTKQKLLPTRFIPIDKDTPTHSMFYFSNISCQVGADGIKLVRYENLKEKVWAQRISPNPYIPFPTKGNSQFEKFCFNISGQDEIRFEALRTNIGYLVHRYQDPNNSRAVIFLDQDISNDETANGGTGKTLLMDCISKVRKVTPINGKKIKSSSNFQNQRVDFDSDIVFYDDVLTEFNLEELYSYITSGFVVEKKYKDEFHIPHQLSPKIAISSNYYVLGTGGNTDERRRCEFELSNYYGGQRQPSDDFGNRFFEDWDEFEWSRFHLFMMECVMEYLEKGLIIAEPINLRKNKLVTSTSQSFFDFIRFYELKTDVWISKKEVYESFKNQSDELRSISSNQFTRWMKIYAKQSDLTYIDRKAGEKYQFMLQSKDSGKEAKNGK